MIGKARFAIILFATIVVGLSLWSWTRTSVISMDNFRKIQEGMTKDEVEAILGPPRWEVKLKGRINPRDLLNIGNIPHMFESAEWWGEAGIIRVCYTEGRVRHAFFDDHLGIVEPLGLVDRLPFLKRFVPQ
jgi:hypothetical protein